MNQYELKTLFGGVDEFSKTPVYLQLREMFGKFISSQPNNSLDFARSLLRAEHVAVGPGCAFGELCDRYVRISLCASEENLVEGLSRLARHLHALAKSDQARSYAWSQPR